VHNFINKFFSGKKESDQEDHLIKPDDHYSSPSNNSKKVEDVQSSEDLVESEKNGQLLEPIEAEMLSPAEDADQATEDTLELAYDQESMEEALDDTAKSPAIKDPEKWLKTPTLKAVQLCHIGDVRSRNEDSSYIFTAESGGQEPLIPFGLYIVADGMGGHHNGHRASKDVSRLVAEHVLDRIYVPLLKNSIQDHGRPPEPVSEVILDAVQIANEHIHNPEPGEDSGTTLTAALVFGRRLYVAHVGDSRAYLLTNGDMQQVTTDHSYVQRLQDAGQITSDEAAVHPQRNMLYRAVGQGGALDVETFTRSLPKQGKLFLCSDGLWGLVSDSSIHDVLLQDASLGVKAEKLVKLALQAGGYDNITAVLVEFDFS
jgi:serine/threonine protein phosphatase PrpC